MKKTAIALAVFTAAVFASSCQKEISPVQEDFGPMTISAVSEGLNTPTKAEMAFKYDILWSANDNIYVTGNSKNATFTLKSGEGTTKGTFECESSPFASGDEVEAFYPASLVQADGSLKWPDKQDINTVVPMYSKKTLGGTNAENFSFASLGSVLQLVFNSKQENVTLKSIIIEDGTKPLSGAFTVNQEGKAVMAANEKTPGITYDLGTGKTLGDGANYFNIAVPAGTYDNLTIIFVTTASVKNTCTFKGSVTLNHNTVGRLTLTGKEFKQFGIGIAKRNNNVDVPWVQLWKNGPKFAEYNVGAANNKAEDYGTYYAWKDNVSTVWGSNWRRPTKEEFDALLDEENCTHEWTTQNGVFGLLCKGIEGTLYESNKVFFPAGGYYNSWAIDQGSYGCYWSSTSGDNSNAWRLYFDKNNTFRTETNSYLNFGYSVRAVLNE